MTNTIKPSQDKTVEKCEALEGCKRKIVYTLIDHKNKTEVTLCKAHFEQGMKAWLEPNPIVQHLMKEGFI